MRAAGNPYWARFTRGSDLWLIPVQGAGPKRITNLAPNDGRGLDNLFCGGSGGVIPRMSSPLWSPDDQKIAFLSSYPHVREFARASDLMVIRPDGGGMRTVRETAHAICPPGPTFSTHPVNPETIELLGWTR